MTNRSLLHPIPLEGSVSEDEGFTSTLGVSKLSGIVALARNDCYVEFYHLDSKSVVKYKEETVDLRKEYIRLPFLTSFCLSQEKGAVVSAVKFLEHDERDLLVAVVGNELCVLEIRFRAWFGSIVAPPEEGKFLNSPLLVHVKCRYKLKLSEGFDTWKFHAFHLSTARVAENRYAIYVASRENGLFLQEYTFYSATKEQLQSEKTAAICLHGRIIKSTSYSSSQSLALFVNENAELEVWIPRSGRQRVIEEIAGRLAKVNWITDTVFWVVFEDGSRRIYVFDALSCSCTVQTSYPKMALNAQTSFVGDPTTFCKTNETWVVAALNTAHSSSKIYAVRTLQGDDGTREYSTLLDIAQTGFVHFYGNKILGSHVCQIHDQTNHTSKAFPAVCTNLESQIPALGFLVLTEQGLNLGAIQLPCPVPSEHSQRKTVIVEHPERIPLASKKPTVAVDGSRPNKPKKKPAEERIEFTSDVGRSVRELEKRVKQAEMDLTVLRAEFLQFHSYVVNGMDNVIAALKEKIDGI